MRKLTAAALAALLAISLTGCSALGDRVRGAAEGWLRSDDLTGVANEDIEATIRVSAFVLARVLTKTVGIAADGGSQEQIIADDVPGSPIFLASVQGVEMPLICDAVIAERCRAWTPETRIHINRATTLPCAPEHSMVGDRVFSSCLYVHNARVRSKQ